MLRRHISLSRRALGLWAILSRRFCGYEVALAMATVLVTFAILVFSEATPKVIAATHPERVAVVASYPLTLLLKVAYPVVWFVNLFVQGLIRLLRVQPEPESTQLTPEELRVLVLESGQFIAKKHRSMLLNLFELVHRGRQISEALTARRQMRRRRRTANLRYRAPRFLNRGNKQRGWLAPSLQHRVDTTLAWVTRLQRWAPVTGIAQELVRFDLQQLQSRPCKIHPGAPANRKF